MDPRPLRALSRDLVRELGMLSQQCGNLALTPIEAHLLIELENAPATNQQLAEKLHIDKSNASRPLARLAERELISWHPHPSDGRSKEARLSLKQYLPDSQDPIEIWEKALVDASRMYGTYPR